MFTSYIYSYAMVIIQHEGYRSGRQDRMTNIILR
jgi:hypothetical protein